MIDLGIFSEEELEYIISVIPRARVIAYLQKNSKEFAKIKPGFRASALPDGQLFPLLYKELQKGNGFIVTLVVGFLKSSVQEIADAYQTECKKRDETTALIYTLNLCYFRNRLNIYFKLVNQEISQTEIDKLVAAMDILQESIDQQKQMKNNLDEKDEQILSLERNLSVLVADKERWKQEKETMVALNDELQVEMKTCLEQNKKLQNEIARCLDLNKGLQDHIDENRASLLHKDTKIQELSRENESLSNQLAEQIEQNHRSLQEIEKLEHALAEQKALPIQHLANDNIVTSSSNISKCYIPADIEEFQELISYYIEDSGITDGKELLTSYIIKVAFSGKPIVGGRQDCRFLVRCLSSILTNGKSFTLDFSDEITIDDICNALNNDCRIVYFDNFIGNFNETVLYSILEKYHNKIVVVSAMFDRTFNYIGIEFLSLCHYFNISRLNYQTEINFDPTNLEEKEHVPTKEILQNAPTASLKSILRDLNFKKRIGQSLLINIETHDDAIAMLVFCIIPFLIDVNGVNPLVGSEKLSTYCEKNRNRNLVEQWFAHE